MYHSGVLVVSLPLHLLAVSSLYCLEFILARCLQQISSGEKIVSIFSIYLLLLFAVQYLLSWLLLRHLQLFINYSYCIVIVLPNWLTIVAFRDSGSGAGLSLQLRSVCLGKIHGSYFVFNSSLFQRSWYEKLASYEHSPGGVMKLIEIFDFHCFRFSYCFAELGDKCFSDLCCLDVNILNSCGFAGAILWSRQLPPRVPRRDFIKCSFAGSLWCFQVFPLTAFDDVSAVENKSFLALNAVEAGGFMELRDCDCETLEVELCKRMRKIVQVHMCGGHRDTAGVSLRDSPIHGCPRGVY